MARSGLDVTYQLLARTVNEAAVDVLVAGLDARDQAFRHRTQRALLERRSPTGHREILRRLASLQAEDLKIIDERPERLVRAVADTLQTADRRECGEVCQAIAGIKLYDAIPALLKVLIETDAANADFLAKATLQLTDLFYEELVDQSEGQSDRKQLDSLRTRLTTALDDAVRKYSRHERTEIVEAFLLIAKMKSVTLRNIVRSSEEACHEALVERLTKGTRGGVIRLLLSFLDDPQMPRGVLDIICSRCDEKFLHAFFHHVGQRLSKSVASTLAQVKSFAWAEPGHEALAQLDDEAQQGAVRVLCASALPRGKVLQVIGYLLLEGKPGGRRAAAEALANFHGAEAVKLTIKAINDDDPEVRAPILKQLRPRKIPGALSLLIRMVGSEDERVRVALQEALPEFSFRQFLTNFDVMPDDMQPVAGHIVKNIDPEIEEKLAAEMAGLSPVRRRKAVLAAGAMGMVPQMEAQVALRLSDEDHMVRVAAAKVLGSGKSMPSWEALRDALLDRSFVVKEAAEQSLQMLSHSLLQTGRMEEEGTQEQEPEEVNS